MGHSLVFSEKNWRIGFTYSCGNSPLAKMYRTDICRIHELRAYGVRQRVILEALAKTLISGPLGSCGSSERLAPSLSPLKRPRV